MRKILALLSCGYALASLPASAYFEVNRGQAGAGVQFVGRIAGNRLLLLTSQGSLVARLGAGRVKLHWLGAADTSLGEGLDPLAGRSHYFTGSQGANWLRGVSHYARVRYRNIYPGIDLIYYGAEGGVEHDFVVHPNADPSRIALRVEGAERIALENSGDVTISAGGEGLRLKAPRLYQTTDPRTTVPGQYALEGNEIRLNIGSYDFRRPLIIDPVLTFSRQYTGDGGGYFARLAQDRAGNTYLLGDTDSTNYSTPNAPQSRPGGERDSFVTKVDRNGDVVWSTYLGGSASESSTGIAVDDAGSVYVSGFTSSSNFPVTPNALQRQKGAAQDGYVARLGPNGDRLLYSTYLGGGGSDFVMSIAIDGAGNAFLTGMTGSPGFPVTAGAAATRYASRLDAFVSKLNPTGTSLVYSTFLGGTADEQGNEIALDGAGSAVVIGTTDSANFPVTPGAWQALNGGLEDAFVTVVAPDGKSFAFSSYFGGRGNDTGRSVAVDGDGSIYIAGSTLSTNFPTQPVKPVTLPSGGKSLPFVARLFLVALTPPAVAGFTFLGSDLWPPPLLSGNEHPATTEAKLAASAVIPALGYARNLVLLPNQAGQVKNVNVVTNNEGATSIHQLDPDSLMSIGAPYDMNDLIADMVGGPGGLAVVGYNKENQPFLSNVLTNASDQPTAGDNQGLKGEPVTTATGEMLDGAADLWLGGPAALGFTRYYGSLLGGNGFRSALGTNWMHNFDQRLVITGSRMTVVLSDGRAVAFARTPTDARALERYPYPYQLAAAGRDWKFLDPSTRLIYTFNAVGWLAGIEDRSGNTLSVLSAVQGPLRVEDGLGRSLTFSYSGGHLRLIEDQTGRRVLFEHSGDNLVRVTDVAGKITEYSYTSAGGIGGLLTARRWPMGNVPVTQEYDEAGRVKTQTDSAGNATVFEFNRPRADSTIIREPLDVNYTHIHTPPDNLRETVDPAGRTSVLSYDSARRRMRITDRLGDSTTTTFHEPSGYPASHTDAEGNTTSYSWTAQSQGPFTFYNLTRVAQADGTTVSYTYDAAGNALTLIDAGGKLWRMTYTPRGQLLTITNPTGGVITYSYNADGTVATVRAASGEMTRFSYDTEKRLAGITHPDATTREYRYDSRNLPVKVTDELGNVYEFRWDDNQRLASLTDPAEKTEVYIYDNDNRLIAVRDRNGNSLSLQRDERGRLVRMTDATGNAITYTYNSLDRVVAIDDPLGRLADLAYDAEGILTSSTDALGRTRQYKSDKLGRITDAATPLGRLYSYGYDRMGRPISTAYPTGGVAGASYDGRGLPVSASAPGGVLAAYGYNDLGLLNQVTDPNGNLWAARLDSGGRLVSSTDPLGRATSLTYNARQRVSRAQTPAGDIRFEYDRAARLTRKTFWDGTELTFRYDANSRLTAANNLSLGYDANGRLIDSNGIGIERDAAGRILMVTLATGKTVQYAYNEAGLVASVTDWLGGVVQFTYDAARQVTEIGRSNGVRTRYTYDGDGLLASIEESGQERLSSIVITRDGGGRIAAVDRSTPLSPALEAGEQAFSFDAAHQLRESVHDGLGRVAIDGSRRYTWDAASRLTGLETGTRTVGYAYDGLGMMVRRGDRTFVQNYALALPSISVVRQGDADLRYYLHLPNGVLLASIEAETGVRRYFHFDELGNTNILTDESGVVTDHYLVTPGGESVTRRGETENPFSFQGAYGVMEEIAAGVYWMRARHYDSTSARFLSPDPQPSLHPRSLSPYQYAWGDPIRFTDPLGLAPNDREIPNAKQQWAKTWTPLQTGFVMWADAFLRLMKNSSTEAEDPNSPAAQARERRMRRQEAGIFFRDHMEQEPIDKYYGGDPANIPGWLEFNKGLQAGMDQQKAMEDFKTVQVYPPGAAPLLDPQEVSDRFEAIYDRARQKAREELAAAWEEMEGTPILDRDRYYAKIKQLEETLRRLGVKGPLYHSDPVQVRVIGVESKILRVLRKREAARLED